MQKFDSTRQANRMTSPVFNTDFDPQYGDVVEIDKKIRRVVAPNPGPFTGPGTGTYIVGNEDVAIIDPGPMMPEHVEAILEGIGRERVSHIIVTHTHTDHSPASRLLRQRTGAPVFAFGPHSNHSAGALEGGVDRDFAPDFIVDDGEVIAGGDWALEAIHTPGHCANHLCFALKDNNALFCGDQLMAWSTTIILPPDGSISAYLLSLERLAARPETVFYPTHGRPITNPFEYIGQISTHRLLRLQQVRNAIAQGVNTIAGIRELTYTHIPPALYSGAELSIQASIEFLLENNEVKTLPSANDNAETAYRLIQA